MEKIAKFTIGTIVSLFFLKGSISTFRVGETDFLDKFSYFDSFKSPAPKLFCSESSESQLLLISLLSTWGLMFFYAAYLDFRYASWSNLILPLWVKFFRNKCCWVFLKDPGVESRFDYRSLEDPLWLDLGLSRTASEEDTWPFNGDFFFLLGWLSVEMSFS